MREEWKTIKDVPVYAVSNLGRVKRISPAINTHVGRILKSRTNPKGYKAVALSNGKPIWRSVHRLVLESFVGKRPKGYVANHDNGIKTDNRLENLEWITPSENNLHALRIGLVIMAKGEDAYRAKLKNNEVWLIKKILAANVVTQRFIAKMFKAHFGTISNINIGKSWTTIEL